MAKEKKFTDVEIIVCEKKCHFNRVTNKTLTDFANRAEVDFDNMVKKWTDKSQKLSLESDKLEKEINRKEQRMELLQLKENPDVDELLKLNDELEVLESKMGDLVEVMNAHLDANPSKQYNEIVDKTLGEKVEILLDNITAEEFESNSTYRDLVIARNLEKYYQMAMMGERPKKIEVEIDEDMKRFLDEQQELREQQ